MKKSFIYGVALAFFSVVALAGISMADKGPADIHFDTKKKPVVFPHAAHQARLECGICHHSKDDAGKQVAYSEGMTIAKCETCHNKDAGMPKKLSNFKGAGHALCKTCHKETDKKLAKCGVCHPKKK